MKFGITLIFKVLIAFVAFSFAASELAFPNEVTDYWDKTGLNETHLKQFLSQQRCYENEDNFLGCIAAVNSVLGYSSPAKIISNKNIQNLKIMGALVTNIERLTIRMYQEPEEGQNTPEALNIHSERTAAINKSWKAVYTLTKSHPLSFEKILSVALGYMNKDLLATKISDSINAFYKVAVDPHTYLISASLRSKQSTVTQSSLVGIGVTLRNLNNSIYLTPKNGSPAHLAGIQPMDILLNVDDEDVSNQSSSYAGHLIRGDANTVVHLTVLRDKKKLSFDILRKEFVEKNLEVYMINDPAGGPRIGYIQLHTFNEIGICKKFVEAAKALYERNARSLILDLRDDGGGYVDEGTCVASSYLEKGKVIFTEHDPVTNAVIKTYRSSDDAPLYRLYKKPLVILINSQSASASEMVSGALRPYGRAILVGENSFGKGTMQAQMNWKDAGGLNSPDLKDIAIMKTKARFHFANGESNQLVGLTPDFEVYSTPNPTAAEKFAMRERDLYPNAIINTPPKPYVPGAKVQEIKKCIAARSTIDPSYANKVNSHLVSDLQVSVATDVSTCL